MGPATVDAVNRLFRAPHCAPSEPRLQCAGTSLWNQRLPPHVGPVMHPTHATHTCRETHRHSHTHTQKGVHTYIHPDAHTPTGTQTHTDKLRHTQSDSHTHIHTRKAHQASNRLCIIKQFECVCNIGGKTWPCSSMIHFLMTESQMLVMDVSNGKRAWGLPRES